MQSWGLASSKVPVHLNLKRDVKDSKTGFYQHIIRKRTTMENLALLRSCGEGDTTASPGSLFSALTLSKWRFFFLMFIWKSPVFLPVSIVPCPVTGHH